MKGLSVAGTIAMFLVGGGILTHGIPALHHAIEDLTERVGDAFAAVLPTVLDGLTGIVAGALALIVVSLGQRLWSRRSAQPA